MLCEHMPLISVIVPVYNVEKYITKCLDSIIHQTYTELEIIVVDDGSKDNSLQIAKEIALTDNRIIVFHKENGGLSSARNYGIDQSHGEFLVFVDSDDYLENDMIEILYMGLKENNVDLSMCTVYDVYPNTDLKEKAAVEEFVVNAEEAIKIVLESKITSVYAVAKLYKKNLFDAVRYPVGKIAEDAFVILSLLAQCNKVYIINSPKYFYIHRENSITTSPFNAKNCDVIEAYEKNYAFVIERYPALEKTAQMRRCWAHFFVLDKLIVAQGDNRELETKIVKFLRKNFMFIMKDDCFTNGRKLAMCALMLNVKLYGFIVKKYNSSRGICS